MEGYGYGRDGGFGRPSFINPEYFDTPGYGAFGFEPQSTDAIDSSEDPASKRRKLENMTICVDYIRGYCPRGAMCVKAHVSHVDSIDEREILAKTKFCHDFQNRGSCDRPSCKFLHVTRREEDEFLLTGEVPEAVFERARSKCDPSRMNAARLGRGGGRGGLRPRGSGMGRGYHSEMIYDYGNEGGRGWDDPPPRNPYRGSRFNSDKETHPFSQPVTFGNYCIDYLKGSCTKGSQCLLDHCETIEDLDHREAIVKNVFCHDFQNKRCPRQHCKYLHATFDEQRVFIERGYLSGSVCERNRNKIFFSGICIDSLRSQCVRGSNCQYQHVSAVGSREERIYLTRSIFCHDFQETSCPRTTCKLLHTGKGDETFFIENGYLPDHLRKASTNFQTYDPSLEAIADTVCRDFVKGMCTRGVSCKFYHPRQEELERLLAYQKSKQQHQASGGSPMPTNNSQQQLKTDNQSLNSGGEIDKMKQENEALKQRVQQLERLLADACHCITLAVGDQNPAIKTLMETIAGMAPESALANTTGTAVDAAKQESN